MGGGGGALTSHESSTTFFPEVLRDIFLVLDLSAPYGLFGYINNDPQTTPANF